MKLTLRSIVLLLAFALLIQNTCPFGAAGKSAVTSSCGSCPLKHCFLVPLDGLMSFVSDPSAIHFPLYVFAVPKTIHTFQLYPVNSFRPLLTDRYRDALPDELLRPPRA